ncbi:MAG: Crp/Fnr family transcriptional regulator [Pseudomonadota bacterium]
MEHLPLGDRIEAMSRTLMMKLGGFFSASPRIGALLEQLCDDVVEFRPGETIIGAGAAYPCIYLLENGWALRSRAMEDGSRQIVNVVLPGDLVGLNALLFMTSDFDHAARTAVTAWRIPADRLSRMLAAESRLGSALFWVNAHEESMLAERIVSLGRRSARVRAAHVLCELIARLEIIERATLPELAIPLSQEDFADVLGISAVHANKVLRGLQGEAVVTFRNNVLMVHDPGALQRIAGFDDGYLHFTRREDRLDG